MTDTPQSTAINPVTELDQKPALRSGTSCILAAVKPKCGCLEVNQPGPSRHTRCCQLVPSVNLWGWALLPGEAKHGSDWKDCGKNDAIDNRRHDW